MSQCASSSSTGTCTNASGYYACDPHTHTYRNSAPVYETCGIHIKGTSGSHAWVASCNVSSGNNSPCTNTSGYYACDPHTHTYDSSQNNSSVSPLPCGLHTTGTSDAHRLVWCPTNSSGQNCSVGSSYVCQSHTHSYPSVPVQTRPCGHSQSSSGNHSWVSCPTNSSGQNCTSGGSYACQSHTHSYPSVPVQTRPCGHSQSSSGNHSWVTCPTNSSGQNCTVGGYYACQSHTHTYPAAKPKPKRPCGHLQSSGGNHSWVTCPTNSSGQNCTSGGSYACKSHTHTYPAVVVCPADAWTNCGGTVSHAATCGQGHTYYTCNPSAVASHSTHKAPTRPCGHSQSSSGNHSKVYCPTNSSGQNCSSVYAYACQSHTHSYPAATPKPKPTRACGHLQSSGQPFVGDLSHE